MKYWNCGKGPKTNDNQHQIFFMSKLILVRPSKRLTKVRVIIGFTQGWGIFLIQYDKSFTDSDLKKHNMTHTGEKPFVCSTRHLIFTKYQLKKPERTHTGEKLFACTNWNKSFAENEGLKKHYKIHTREKPFTCPNCENSFVCNHSWKTHENIYTEGNHLPVTFVMNHIQKVMQGVERLGSIHGGE